MRFVIILASLVAVSLGSAVIQCHCDDYLKCKDEGPVKKPFGNCVKKCFDKVASKGVVVRAGCLDNYEMFHKDTLRCVARTLGSGCTSSRNNVVSVTNDIKFSTAIEDKLDELTALLGFTLDYRTHTAREFNTCIMRCFIPTENQCTKRLQCGIFYPPEEISVKVVEDCAMSSHIPEENLRDMAQCTRKHVQFPKEERRMVEAEDALRDITSRCRPLRHRFQKRRRA